jgi:hypothetical protein
VAVPSEPERQRLTQTRRHQQVYRREAGTLPAFRVSTVSPPQTWPQVAWGLLFAEKRPRPAAADVAELRQAEADRKARGLVARRKSDRPPGLAPIPSTDSRWVRAGAWLPASWACPRNGRGRSPTDRTGNAAQIGTLAGGDFAGRRAVCAAYHALAAVVTIHQGLREKPVAAASQGNDAVHTSA